VLADSAFTARSPRSSISSSGEARAGTDVRCTPRDTHAARRVQQEVQLRFDDRLWPEGRPEQLDSRTTFVNNELARFYGVPEATRST
jgi:hypothetical protein